MFSYSGLSFNAAASRELGLMPSYNKTQEDSDCEDIWHSLSSSMMWMTIDMDESESSSKEGSEEVRTVFVSGLPMDVRPREIYLLFRPYSGYVGSCLKLMAKPGKLTQPVAFVTFETRKQAEKAISDLQGICFDPSQAQTLRLELARSNSRNAVKKTVPVKAVNRGGTFVQFPAQSAVPNGYGFLNLTHNPWGPPQPAPVPVGTYVDMTPYGGFEESPTPPGPGLPTHPSQPQLIQGFFPGLCPAYSNMYHTPHQYVCMGPVQWPPGHVVPMAATIPEHNNNGGHSYDHDMSGEVGNPLMNHSANVEFEEQSTMDNGILNPAPCSTLFVANLEPHQHEEEITSLFSACEGFVKAKIYAKNGPPVCFVHFKDVSSAMQSMNTLQGYVLPTSRRGCGIRIEYARQRMGSPRRSSTSSTRSTSTPHSDSSSTYSN